VQPVAHTSNHRFPAWLTSGLEVELLAGTGGCRGRFPILKKILPVDENKGLVPWPAVLNIFFGSKHLSPRRKIRFTSRTALSVQKGRAAANLLKS